MLRGSGRGYKSKEEEARAKEHERILRRNYKPRYRPQYYFDQSKANQFSLPSSDDDSSDSPDSHTALPNPDYEHNQSTMIHLKWLWLKYWCIDHLRHHVVESKPFDIIILVAICINCIFLAMEDPKRDPSSDFAR